MVAMVAFGVGEILGCFFIGYFVDNYGSKICALINVGIIIIMSGVTIGSIMMNDFNTLTFVMTFMWGF